MCITEEKLVEGYGNSNPHERFLLIYPGVRLDGPPISSVGRLLRNRVV